MKKLLLLTVCVSFFLTSCGTVGYVSTPSTYDNAGKKVTVTMKGTNILGLSPLDAQKKAESALQELRDKCGGEVVNVTTTVSMKGFFIFGFEKLEMSGNCK
ncbi:hypothetical protein C8N46_10748 [Kordia periserrulae]|uniref:Lipoprotein n=1 Tax=Kordia periserrulae TaxID=701523 RepID=A0A2T6BVF5_9FLAO|nr:hypothetical protein [Kordia periserrulae]PTX60042.1 hypothetical protein C8N46_10748 [Kordia periserrulae]